MAARWCAITPSYPGVASCCGCKILRQADGAELVVTMRDLVKLSKHKKNVVLRLHIEKPEYIRVKLYPIRDSGEAGLTTHCHATMLINFSYK
jgi:hypothetical protein